MGEGHAPLTQAEVTQVSSRGGGVKKFEGEGGLM